MNHGRYPEEGALHLPGAARTSIIPDVRTPRRKRRQPDIPPPRNTSQLGRRRGPHGAALERSRIPAGWKVPAPRAESTEAPRAPSPARERPFEADSGVQSPVRGLHPLTCSPRRPRPDSKLSSRSLQTARGTECPLLTASDDTPPTVNWLLSRDGPSPLVVPPSLQIQVGPQALLRSYRLVHGTGKSRSPGPGPASFALPSEGLGYLLQVLPL